jgi:hypothetical protein
MLESLSSSRTFCHFRACSAGTAPGTGVREYKVHAGCWTILHLLKASMPDPAGTTSGTGIREYMKKAGHDLNLEER